MRGAGYRKAVPPELAPESVLDVHKVEDLQAALFEASHKLGRLYDGDHYGALAGAGGLELAFSTRLAPDEALLLMAATANVRSLQAYLDGTSWQDPRWI